MTLLTDISSPAPQATGRRPRAGLVLLVAVVVAAFALAGAALRWPFPVEVVLLALAVVVTGWAAWVAVRRPSLVLAPLAVCILALGNPATLAGTTAFVQDHAGVITVRTQDGFGLVFWKQYPGVAGWTAPADPAPVDTVAFAASAQAAVRGIVDALSAEGREWTASSTPSGLQLLPNGYGGPSMFDRVDSAEWHTTLDGSAAQRATLLAAARETAQALGLADEQVVTGDPLSGTATTTWSDADGVLTLVLADDAVTVSYSGGPFLRATALPGEFAQRMSAFAGLTPPAPLVAPDVLRR